MIESLKEIAVNGSGIALLLFGASYATTTFEALLNDKKDVATLVAMARFFIAGSTMGAGLDVLGIL